MPVEIRQKTFFYMLTEPKKGSFTYKYIFLQYSAATYMELLSCGGVEMGWVKPFVVPFDRAIADNKLYTPKFYYFFSNLK